MSQDTPLVRNAADPAQVRHARRRERDRRSEELAALRTVLNTEAGRRVLWDLLSYCGVFKTPASSDAARQNQNIGMGDVGRFIIGEITQVNQEQYFLMMREAQKRDAAYAREDEATRTRAATGGPDEQGA